MPSHVAELCNKYCLWQLGFTAARDLQLCGDVQHDQ